MKRHSAKIIVTGFIQCKFKTRLGNRIGDEFRHVVKGGTYQAAYTTGEYSFMGCTVAPGFDFSDFWFLSDDKGAEDLVSRLEDKYRLLL